MPSGGAIDKFGNRYEGRWTVFCMIDVMEEKADSIHLEKAGLDAAEFVLHKEGKSEYHQVKRQKAGLGHWTLSVLEDKKIQVLSDFWELLKAPNSLCVFVSTQDADQLGELADHSRNTQSFQEFEDQFLKTKRVSKNFKTLCQKWFQPSEQEAYEALKRIQVRTIDEDLLIQTVESRLAPLVEGDPKTIRIELAQLAWDKIHHKLTGHDIWHYLTQERGYRRREWGKDPHVMANIDKANKNYLSILERNNAIAGKTIPRTETETTLEKLKNFQGKRGILLVGEAGVGKSGVMLEVTKRLQEQRMPLLAFRIDNLEPTSNPDKLGEHLELPASPALVLANIAQQKECILVIDQLDAVSLASGRNPDFFDCVDLIIQQAEAHPNIHLLLACRRFDLDNDHRLKGLVGKNGIAETVTINRLEHSKVKEIVGNLGLNTTRLKEKQLNLLSIPLHLSLLAEIAENPTVDVLQFKTAKDLYDKFSDYKQDRLKARLGYSVQWTKVTDKLCQSMSKKQTLSAPITTVRDYSQDAKAMASEHILVKEGKRFRFFHESFFDYAFAQYFSASGQNLLELLCSSEQHLFRRAQVRQILLHQREDDFEEYLDNLQELLTNSQIRFHIKQVVVALLATLDDPQEEEWEILAPSIEKEDNPLNKEVWKTLRLSVQWFKLLHRLGVFARWFREGSEKLINEAVFCISFLEGEVLEQVAELVEPYINASDAWNNNLIFLIGRSKVSINRRFFELFLRLINEGICDRLIDSKDINQDFWFSIHSLPEHQPTWACEAIGCYLNRRLKVELESDKFALFLSSNDSVNAYEIFLKSAKNTPEEFVVQVLPFIFRVLETVAIAKTELLRHLISLVCYLLPVDLYWPTNLFLLKYLERQSLQLKSDPWTSLFRYRFDCIEDYLLIATKSALCSLASSNSPSLRQHIESLKSFDYEVTTYLIINIYTAAGKNLANEAINYLCEQPERLGTSYRLRPPWPAKELIEAITPHCFDENLVQLEEVLLNYYPSWEKRQCSQGKEQYILLNGIPEFRRSERVCRRLRECYRRFGKEPNKSYSTMTTPPPVAEEMTIEDYKIPPPIPSSAIEKMTDEQWLGAIEKYNPDYEYHKDGKRVDSRGIVFFLEGQVKKEPERFVKLIWELPNNTHPEYFDGVLRGLAEVVVDEQTVLRVCQRCHQLPNRPCGRSMSSMVRELANLAWPEEIFETIAWYALHDSDPSKSNNSTSGINTTRGSATEAIAALIYANKSRAAYFQPTLEQIVQDPSLGVRACAAEALTAMLNYDRDIAISLFERLCDANDALLGTRTVGRFLYYGLGTHFERLKPILERMLSSQLPEVAQAGSRLACLESLHIQEAKEFAEHCLSGTEAHRIAASKVFAANLRSAHFRELCEKALVRLFRDENKKVRSEAARCLWGMEGDELRNYTHLLKQFIDSPIFKTSTTRLLMALKRTTAKLPEINYRVGDRFMQQLTSGNPPNGRPWVADIGYVSELMVRAYYQNQRNEDFQSRCLDLIDRIAEIGVGDLDRTLEQYER